jgi:hypothetical protein
MKKASVITVAILFALTVTSVIFAEEKVVPPVEGSLPTKEPGPNFEQMKADHLKILDERMNSLQQEKTCVQAAKNPDDLKACRSKHRSEMKKHRDDMRKGVGPGGPGSQIPPQSQ